MEEENKKRSKLIKVSFYFNSNIISKIYKYAQQNELSYSDAVRSILNNFFNSYTFK